MKLAFPVLALFLFAACGDGVAHKVVGTYALDTRQMAADINAAMKGQPGWDDARARKAAEGIETKMQVTLEIKADGTVETKQTGLDRQEAKGTWKVDGDKITITTTNEHGTKDIKTGTIQDGTITVEMPAGTAPVPVAMKMTFRKK